MRKGRKTVAADLNEVRLVGRLAHDPEIKYTTTGKAVANISIATSYKDNTEFHRVTCWESVTDKLAGMKKGDAIRCTGRLQTRSFEKDGVKKYVTEIVAWGLGVPGDEAKPLTPAPAFDKNLHGLEITDSDIPF
jgi:single-strand DNA-binding protein